jgi:hypothetical protein
MAKGSSLLPSKSFFNSAKRGPHLCRRLNNFAGFLGDDAMVCHRLFGGRSHLHDKIVVFVVVLTLSITRDRFFFFNRLRGFRRCCSLSRSRCLRSSRPTFSSCRRSLRRAHGFFRRRCSTLVALAALPAFARCHAVAFFLIVASFASKLAATAATITIVAIVIGVIVVSSTMSSRRSSPRAIDAAPTLRSSAFS